MQCSQRNDSEQRVGIAEWRERCDVGVHDAVQDDVGVGSCGSTQCRGRDAQGLPTERIREPEPACDPTASQKQCKGRQHHQRSTHVCMEEPMQTCLMSEHVVQRLNVDQNVCRTEGEKAYVLGRDGMNGCPRSKMKWRNWHVLMRRAAAAATLEMHSDYLTRIRTGTVRTECSGSSELPASTEGRRL